MERKAFKSRLFNRNISPDHVDYWQILYAEILYRLKALDDLNCKCSFCFRDRVQLNGTLRKIVSDDHIKVNSGTKNFTGEGNCGRKLGPVA